jgi:hypothetical protein
VKNKLRGVGRTRFTEGVERDVFEDAEGRQFVQDDGELIVGRRQPLADESAVAEHT